MSCCELLLGVVFVGFRWGGGCCWWGIVDWWEVEMNEMDEKWKR